MTLSEVESTMSLLMWKTELARATAMRESAERHERFAQERYVEALEQTVAPTVDKPPSKRPRIALREPKKGNGKAREVEVEEVEDEEAELGGSKVDEAEP